MNIFTLLFLVGVCLAATDQTGNNFSPQIGLNFYERVLYYTNLAREQPAKFKEYITEELLTFKDDFSLSPSPNLSYKAKEGKKAWLEAY